MQDSPLYEHLPPGSMLMALDDVSLATDDPASKDLWNSYLLKAPEHGVATLRGWCVPEALLDSTWPYLAFEATI